MMRRFAKLSMIAMGVLLPLSAQAASVTLQGSTPGTADVGHINVTGTIIGDVLQAATLNVSGDASVGGSLSTNTIDPTSSLVVGDTSNSLMMQGGSVSIKANAGGYTNTLVFATPAASNKTITLPDASGNVCLDVNNCGYVNLLSSIPGPTQTGHMKISGELYAGNIHVGLGDFAGTVATNSGFLSNSFTPISTGSNMNIGANSTPLRLKGSSVWMDVVTGTGSTSVRLESPTTWNNIIRFPSASGVVCVSGNCDGYATRTLNNLQSVAINTSLLPASSGGADLGSSAKKFGDLYLSGNAAVGGSLAIGGGTAITKHLSATSSQASQSLPSAVPGCVSFNVTVAGAAMGDTVVAAVDQALPGTWTVNGAVSATDTVTVKACAFDNTTSIAAGTYRVDVWKH